jgi:hypothetical protein
MEELNMLRWCDKSGKTKQELKLLRKENPVGYKEYVLRRTKEVVFHYLACRETFGNRFAKKAYMVYDVLGPKFTPEFYGKLCREINNRIRICEKWIRFLETWDAASSA